MRHAGAASHRHSLRIACMSERLSKSRGDRS
jgi:hypothetical protein